MFSKANALEDPRVEEIAALVRNLRANTFEPRSVIHETVVRELALTKEESEVLAATLEKLIPLGN